MAENEHATVRSRRILNLVYWMIAAPSFIIFLIAGMPDNAVPIVIFLWILGGLGAFEIYIRIISNFGGGRTAAVLGVCLIGGPVAWSWVVFSLKFCEACGGATNGDAIFCPRCGYKRKQMVGESPG